MSDAAGRRTPLAIGLAAYVLASVGCNLAPSISPVVALRLVQGVAGGVGTVIARGRTRRLRRRGRRPRLRGADARAGRRAGLRTPGRRALLKVTSWRGVFGLLAIAGVLLLAATLAGLPESPV